MPLLDSMHDRSNWGVDHFQRGGEVPSRTIGAFNKTSLVLKTRTETAPQTSPLPTLSLSIAKQESSHVLCLDQPQHYSGRSIRSRWTALLGDDKTDIRLTL